MNKNHCYKIVVIDDHPLMRKGIIQLLSLQEHFELVGEASNGEDGVQISLQTQPDIILLDLNMDGLDGIATLKLLRENEVDAKIIVFTVSDDDEDVIHALKNGADGYLLKDMDPELLLEKINLATTGQMVISDKLMRVLATALQDKNSAVKAKDIQELTKREKEILKHIVAGQSNKVIAKKLKISDGTVKVHVKHLLKKLHVNSRLEAAVWAMENKVFD